MTPSPQEQTFGSALLFEVAWEVCNQIGGIYTVLKTKARAMREIWGDNYYLVGPYVPKAAGIEFEEAPPTHPMVQHAVAELNRNGIVCRTGLWLVPGRPKVILLDHRTRYSTLAQDKYFLYRDHGIELGAGDWELDDLVAFGFLVEKLVCTMSEAAQLPKVVVHFHEWMASIALPRIRHCKCPLTTIFTTHATLVGRYVASEGGAFYENLHNVDGDAAARHYNILARHQIEKAAAHSAHVFTTISDVTAREAEQILGRRPDHILPNGLNVERFTALHEFQNLHLKYKERIHEFVMGHFFPSYSFDLDRTLYLFTSGRYEYRNKGMEVFIESLYRLNVELKKFPNPPTVVAFIITRGPTKNINVKALQNHLMFEDLKHSCTELQDGVAERVLHAVTRGRLPSYEELVPHDFQIRFKRTMHALRNESLPQIVTHDMEDDAGDPVLNHIRHRGLFNSASDPVKIVFHPEFVTAMSPLLNLDYDQFVRGCHMGVFPSYYEPWGYTPLECLALGLPTVTTDLSGFGSYVQREIENPTYQGIYVLERVNKTSDESINLLSKHLLNFCQLGRRERIELRNRSERLTDRFDWSVLVREYRRSHEIALQRYPSAPLVTAQT